MSLETVSTKRARVYHRSFDHEEAQRLRAQGWSYGKLADHFGVSEQAVARVCSPALREKMARQSIESMRKKRIPCKGGCGTLVWTHSSRSGYCLQCVGALRVIDDVREGELRCSRCREWRPDKDFPTYRGLAVRRGRNSQCRTCAAEVRKAHRHRRPDIEQINLLRVKEQRRRLREEKEEMATMTYIVLRPDGNGGYAVHRKEVVAASPAHAVELTAEEPGKYIAVLEGKFQVMEVEPIQVFKVVKTDR